MVTGGQLLPQFSLQTYRPYNKNVISVMSLENFLQTIFGSEVDGDRDIYVHWVSDF